MPVEGVSLFYLAGGDYVEEGFAKHALILAEMVYLVLRRLNLQELFYGVVIPEGVVRDGSGEHCQHWIAKKRLRLQALVHGVFWPVHQVNKNAVVSAIIRIAGGEPFLRRLSHVFRILHDLDGELGFSVFVTKDSKVHILYEVISACGLL